MTYLLDAFLVEEHRRNLDSTYGAFKRTNLIRPRRTIAKERSTPGIDGGLKIKPRED